MGWFVSASLVSLTLGLVMVHLLQPGVGLALPIPTPAPPPAVDRLELDAQGLRHPHLVPRSIVEAMANNEILQIVVFSVFVGIAISPLGGARASRARPGGRAGRARSC